MRNDNMIYNYENFMYLSKLLNDDTNVYKITKQEDISEIQAVIDYAEGLIIKDDDKAMETETIYSNKQAAIYISAILDTSDTYTEFEKQLVINSYTESNPYYIQLKEEYGIPYLDARMAKDYTILKATKNSLTPDEKILFEACYQHSIDYFIKVLNNKAFSAEPLNKCYFRDIIVFFAVQKYITRKMERYFDPRLYTEYECKNTFISYGIDYFDQLPIEYKRKLICSINSIIKYKGTDKCLNMILEAFGLQNVKIYKYMVAKDQVENKLIAYRVPLTEEVNTETDPVVSLDQLTKNDALWQCSDEEILEHEFNVVNTKYISVNVAIDMLKGTYDMAYAISILEYLEHNFIDNLNRGDFSITYKEISNDPIYIFDLLIAIIIMTYRKNNVLMNISSNLATHRSNGFNLHPMDNECRRIIRNIQMQLIKDRKNYASKEKYVELYDFFVGFNLENFDNKNLYSETELKNVYKANPELYRKQIMDIAIKYQFNNIIKKLEENDDIAYILLDILEFYSGVIALNILDIIDVKESYYKLYVLLCKYNIYTYRSEDPVKERLANAIVADDAARKELKELIIRQDNESLTRMFEEGDVEGMIALIKIITEKRREELMPTMSIQDMNDQLAKDNTDILHYKRVNAYFEMFTKFYVTKTVTYNLNDIGRIFEYNSGLRDKLDQYITECNNIDLYNEYMRLWDKVFMIDVNTTYLQGYTTWEDLLRDRNIDLYNYTTPPKSLESRSKTKEWINSTLFRLCELMDTYFNINRSLFSESSFIGAHAFISKFIKVAVTLFKAYTIDLTAGMDSVIYDSRRESTIKLTDWICMDMYDSYVDHIALEDFYHFEIRDWCVKDELNMEDIAIFKVRETRYGALCTLNGRFEIIEVVGCNEDECTNLDSYHVYKWFTKEEVDELLNDIEGITIDDNFVVNNQYEEILMEVE